LKHLIVCDGSIPVNIIQLERPFELLIQSATRGDAECADELFEVDCAVLVLVEDVEYIVGKFTRVAEREELLVYPAELSLVELARGTILEETLVPLLKLAFINCDGVS